MLACANAAAFVVFMEIGMWVHYLPAHVYASAVALGSDVFFAVGSTNLWECTCVSTAASRCHFELALECLRMICLMYLISCSASVVGFPKSSINLASKSMHTICLLMCMLVLWVSVLMCPT